MRTSVMLQKQSRIAAQLESTLQQMEALRIAQADQPHPDIGDLILEKEEEARRLRRCLRQQQ